MSDNALISHLVSWLSRFLTRLGAKEQVGLEVTESIVLKKFDGELTEAEMETATPVEIIRIDADGSRHCWRKDTGWIKERDADT